MNQRIQVKKEILSIGDIIYHILLSLVNSHAILILCFLIGLCNFQLRNRLIDTKCPLSSQWFAIRSCDPQFRVRASRVVTVHLMQESFTSSSSQFRPNLLTYFRTALSLFRVWVPVDVTSSLSFHFSLFFLRYLDVKEFMGGSWCSIVKLLRWLYNLLNHVDNIDLSCVCWAVEI